MISWDKLAHQQCCANVHPGLFFFQDKKGHQLSECEMLKGGQTDKLNSCMPQGSHGYICKGLEGI